MYQDLAQPSVKEISQTVARAVKLALLPLNGICWSVEKLIDFIFNKLALRLEHIPLENIETPRLNIAGPVFESLRYCTEEPLLCDLYANLLASSMNKSTRSGVLPSFVETIKQLSSDDAKLLKLFAQDREFPLLTVRWEYKTPSLELRGGEYVLENFSHLGKEASLEYPKQAPVYLENLCRLKLIEIPFFFEYTAPGIYNALENDPLIIKTKLRIEKNSNHRCVLEKRGARVTEFGKLFIKLCVSSQKTTRLDNSITL